MVDNDSSNKTEDNIVTNVNKIIEIKLKEILVKK